MIIIGYYQSTLRALLCILPPSCLSLGKPGIIFPPSMFFNINTGLVEDLTGRGREDLRAGIIRTPLHPLETFLDGKSVQGLLTTWIHPLDRLPCLSATDPLRVLRAVRFSTRFGFALEESLVEAASSEKVMYESLPVLFPSALSIPFILSTSPQVRKALSDKVSKERVGTELEGMIQGPAPVKAMRLLESLDLFSTVFSIPEDLSYTSRFKTAFAMSCVNCMEAAYGLSTDLGLSLDKEDSRFLLMSSLLIPLRHLQVCFLAGVENICMMPDLGSFQIQRSFMGGALDLNTHTLM